MTAAQKRLFDLIADEGGRDDGAEYWPVMNTWVRDSGRARSLALRNINASVAALLKTGLVTLDDGGLFHIAPPRAAWHAPELVEHEDEGDPIDNHLTWNAVS